MPGRSTRPLHEKISKPLGTETKQAVEYRHGTNEISDQKRGRWKNAFMWTWFLLAPVAWPIVQLLFGEGNFWQLQQRDFEKGKYRIELYEKLTQTVSQAIQVNQEHVDSCTLRIKDGEQEVLKSVSFAEREKKGCKEKETRLSLLNETIDAQEKQLAKLESREPRNLNVNIVRFPLPPTNFKIQIQ